jgi:hypothetical protein
VSGEIDAPRRQCDTDSSRGSPAGPQASQMETLWRRDAGLDLAVEAGVAPVVLPWQPPFYHATGPTQRWARLQSPYGLLTSRITETPCSSRADRLDNFYFYLRVVPPLYDAA